MVSVCCILSYDYHVKFGSNLDWAFLLYVKQVTVHFQYRLLGITEEIFYIVWSINTYNSNRTDLYSQQHNPAISENWHRIFMHVLCKLDTEYFWHQLGQLCKPGKHGGMNLT